MWGRLALDLKLTQGGTPICRTGFVELSDLHMRWL